MHAEHRYSEVNDLSGGDRLCNNKASRRTPKYILVGEYFANLLINA